MRENRGGGNGKEKVGRERERERKVGVSYLRRLLGTGGRPSVTWSWGPTYRPWPGPSSRRNIPTPARSACLKTSNCSIYNTNTDMEQLLADVDITDVCGNRHLCLKHIEKDISFFRMDIHMILFFWMSFASEIAKRPNGTDYEICMANIPSASTALWRISADGGTASLWPLRCRWDQGPILGNSSLCRSRAYTVWTETSRALHS